MRKSGTRPSPDQQAAIHDKRMKLQKRIDEFHRSSYSYLPFGSDSSVLATNLPDDFEWEYEDEDDDTMPGSYPEDEPGIVEFSNSSLPAEKQRLILPSSFGKGPYTLPVKAVRMVELSLRQGQANDALHSLHLAIGQRSFLFRKKVRQGHTSANSGYHNRLRSYAEVQAVGGTVDCLAKVYSCARNAMISLDADADLMSKYKLLSKADLTASTAVVDPNARGQRNNGLSWIWQSHHSAAEDPVWMQERKFGGLASIFYTHTTGRFSLSGELASGEVEKG